MSEKIDIKVLAEAINERFSNVCAIDIEASANGNVFTLQIYEQEGCTVNTETVLRVRTDGTDVSDYKSNLKKENVFV